MFAAVVADGRDPHPNEDTPSTPLTVARISGENPGPSLFAAVGAAAVAAAPGTRSFAEHFGHRNTGTFDAIFNVAAHFPHLILRSSPLAVLVVVVVVVVVVDRSPSPTSGLPDALA